MSPARKVLFYAGYIVGWTAAITAGSALVGLITFPLIGVIAGRDDTIAAMALSGARNLGFLAFVWAPGTAIVLAFRHGFRRAKSESASNP